MKLRPFELALVIIFGGMALLSVILLSAFSPKNEGELALSGVNSPVTIWGTFPQTAVDGVLSVLAEADESYELISYRQYSPENFDNNLVNALADGAGPDLILVSQEKLVEMRRRIQPISYDSFPLRDIKNRYLEGAEIFALNDGLYGYPVAVDPIMMYWNRDILTTAGFLEPPSTWEQLINSFLPSLVVRDNNRTIKRPVVAMGEYNNVKNAFGVVSLLLLQSGTTGVEIDDVGKYQVKLRVAEGGGPDPLQTTIDFYTRFNKPSNALYSWNRSFSSDQQEFTAGNLAFYFGFGSEGRVLERMNPNLNFDIAEVPQGASDTVRRTYGKIYALSLLNSSQNRGSAIAAMNALVATNVVEALSEKANMAPAYRSSVSAGSNDVYGRVVYRSAPVALGWLNPDKSASDEIFSTMVGDVSENRRNVAGAATDAVEKLGYEYR